MSKLLIGLLTAGTALVVAAGISATAPTAVVGPVEKIVAEEVTTASETTTVTEDPAAAMFAGKPTQLKAKESEVVYLEGPVNAASTELVTSALMEQAKTRKTLYLFIDSPGGSILHGAKIVSALKALRPTHHIVTVCTGLCASMAAIIFEYGEDRVMASEAVLMFHQASGGFMGELPRIKSVLAVLDSYIDALDSEIVARTGDTLANYHKKIANELWLTAGQALKSRYADRIALLPTVVADNSKLQAFTGKKSASVKVQQETDTSKLPTKFFITNEWEGYVK